MAAKRHENFDSHLQKIWLREKWNQSSTEITFKNEPHDYAKNMHLDKLVVKTKMWKKDDEFEEEGIWLWLHLFKWWWRQEIRQDWCRRGIIGEETGIINTGSNILKCDTIACDMLVRGLHITQTSFWIRCLI